MSEVPLYRGYSNIRSTTPQVPTVGLCLWGIFPLVAIAGVTLHKVVHFSY